MTLWLVRRIQTASRRSLNGSEKQTDITDYLLR
jgi:hypothetical protein